MATTDTEATVAAFESLATEQGALGFFRDVATGALVAVMPADVSAVPNTDSLTAVGEVARVDFADVTQDQVLSAERHLESMGQEGQLGARYAYLFDPKARKVALYADAAEDQIVAALGRDANVVSYHAGGVVSLSRTNDQTPFWGGAVVQEPARGTCTTGFTVAFASGTRALTTAGHCWKNPTAVFTGGNVALGTTGHIHCNPGDYEAIEGKSYGPYIYVGGASGTGVPVKSAGDPAVGLQYWWSGVSTFENSATATSITASVNEGTGNCGNV